MTSCPEREKEQDYWIARIRWPYVWASATVLAIFVVIYGVVTVEAFRLGTLMGHLQSCAP